MKHYSFYILLLVFVIVSCNKVNDPYPPNPDSKYFKNVIEKSVSDTSITFIVIGDWGKQTEPLVSISNQMAEVAEFLEVNYVITAGDNFYNEGVDSISDPLWSVFADNFNQEALQIPWYISLGNHDHFGSVQAQVDYSEIDERWTLPSTFYTLNKSINNEHDSLGMIIIDSYRLRADENELNQLNWIDSVAQSLSTSWKIMIGHHPLYSYGHHGEDFIMQDLLEEVLENNEIDIYISGHEHDLQHLSMNSYTDFFISGTAAIRRETDSGEYSLFSSSEYGFLCIQLSENILKSYFINREGEVLYNYNRIE